MNYASHAKSIVGIVIVCVISGLISSRMVTQGFRSALTIGEEALVYPGIIFGLFFSITSAGAYLWNNNHKIFESIVFVFLFTIASTIIYFIAFQIGMWTLLLQGSSNRIGFVPAFLPGGLAGLFGAAALSIATKYISKTQINIRDHIVTALIGSIAGIVFLLL